MARLFSLFLLIVALTGTAAAAASPWQTIADPIFVHVDTRGLPESAVMTVAQDTAGFMWIGTQGGLARFDGYRYRSFLPSAVDPGALPDGYVRVLHADANQGMWIGSSSSGLVHFDAATETFRTWRPDAAGRMGPRSAAINAILTAPDGGLWIGGDGGLDHFDPRTGRFAPIALGRRYKDQPVVWALLRDRAGTLWAGTQRGIYLRTAGSARFRGFPAHRPAGAAAPAIYSLYEDHAGIVWAGSINALVRIDPRALAATLLTSSARDAATLAPGQQWAIAEMATGVLWVGTDSALSIVETATRRVRRVAPDPENAGGLTGGRIVEFVRDRSGLVWIANHVGGLLLYNPSSTGLYELSTTRPSIGFTDKGAVGVAASGDERLWIGGFGGRVAEIAPDSGRLRSLTLPNHAAVQQLLSGRDGTLWIGTTSGLCVLAPRAARATCPVRLGPLTNASIYALADDGKRLWVGGSAGLVADDLATGTIATYPARGARPFSNNQIRVLYEDRERRMWVGSENGLNRIDPGGRIARFVFAPGAHDGIGPGGMASILEDRRGRIWAGANGGPLELLQTDRGGAVHFRRLGVADGMPHENVNGLAEDARGQIWVSTDKGIAVFDPVTLRARAFGVADGVSDGAYWAGAVSASRSGTVFFGGLDGVAIVAPGAKSAWTYAPPLVASTLAVGRRSVSAAGVNGRNATVTLPREARDVSIEFAALDYSSSQTLRYRYKLDGYDRDWIEADATHRIASYSHLPPGTYAFEVRGTNRLGAWSTNGLRLTIHALPAWYETWWFRVLVAALVLVAAYLVHRMRTSVLRARQHELEALVDERTKALSQANIKLQELSVSDPLTGLRNRRFLTEHLAPDVAGSVRRYEDWSGSYQGELPADADLLFFVIDLDHLKLVNDRFGHHAGDLVLMQMRDRLLEVFRDSDFVVRWGGDEFLAVARGSRRSDAELIAERVCGIVASRAFALGGGQSTQATVSVGFAAYPFVPLKPGVVTWEHVVDLADQALYLAKESGRNTWCGLAAGIATDPETLVHRLEHNAEAAVRAETLAIVRPHVTS